VTEHFEDGARNCWKIWNLQHLIYDQPKRERAKKKSETDLITKKLPNGSSGRTDDAARHPAHRQCMDVA
jgi:hypothetical protein